MGNETDMTERERVLLKACCEPSELFCYSETCPIREHCLFHPVAIPSAEGLFFVPSGRWIMQGQMVFECEEWA